MRWLVAALLAANVLFYAWSRGWLPVAPATDREPARLSRQVEPQRVRVLPAQAASAPIAGVAVPACLAAGPFDDAGLTAVEQALAAAGVAPALVARAPVERGGVWAVYMGRFADRETLARKVDELKRLRLAPEEVHDAPAFEPGLALGRYDSAAAAETALGQLAQRGVRTARVVVLQPPRQLQLLRIERPDAALASALTGLEAPALSGAGFVPCPTPS